jgi:hypothetical protein
MKAIRLFLILSFLVVALGFAARPAEAGQFTYTSSINMQNLENIQADITVIFYDQAGQIVNAVSDYIDPLGSKVYYPLTQVNPGFNGSVVISSNTMVASISNILGNDGLAAASYVGANSGQTTALLPVLMKNNGGYSTFFNIQNAGSADASVTITYSDGTTPINATIKPGSAKTFDQLLETHNPDTKAVFSAIVTSNQPIVATAIEENPKIMFAYSSFPTGSSLPVFPLVNANNSGYQTGINIQNSGSSNSVVRVDYTPSKDSNGNLIGSPCYEQGTILAKKSLTFAFNSFQGVADPNITTNCTAYQKFVGSAKVTSNSASQPLVAVVNQLKSGLNGGAYGSFDPSLATSKVILPLVMANNGGYYTSINLANVGGGSTTVTCTFVNSAVTASRTLAAGEGVSLIQTDPAQFGGTKYVGSATCTASGGGKIVAIVNELGASRSADQLLVYEGLNQ